MRRCTFPGRCEIYFRAAAALASFTRSSFTWLVEFGLRRLCSGEFRRILVDATADEFCSSQSIYIGIDEGTDDLRNEAGYLGLEQDASVAIFFLIGLEAVFEHFGNRGYRAAQLEAGLMGGRVYLAVCAQDLGASGLTFYDDDVVSFFSPHAEAKNAVFLVAIGKSTQRSR